MTKVIFNRNDGGSCSHVRPVDYSAFKDGGEASALCTSFSTTSSFGLRAPTQNSPLPHGSGLPMASQWVAAGVAAEDNQFVESQAEISGNSHEVSTNDAVPTASPDNHASESESRPKSRSDKEKGYPCPYSSCQRILKTLYTQQLHMKTHIAKPRKTFTCTMGCSESFTRHHDRLRHEVSQHGKQCEFSCKRCDRFFSSQRMLDRHTCWSSKIGLLRWQLKGMFRSHAVGVLRTITDSYFFGF